jgi:hypothetical protein
MTTQSTCPNCQQLLAELERLRAQSADTLRSLRSLRVRLNRVPLGRQAPASALRMAGAV